jgi:hypothetical protein
MEQQCIRANYDTIERLLRSRGYEIVWKVDDDDWDALSNGGNPQFHTMQLKKVTFDRDTRYHCNRNFNT